MTALGALRKAAQRIGVSGSGVDSAREASNSAGFSGLGRSEVL